jgi:hypothetical protein
MPVNHRPYFDIMKTMRPYANPVSVLSKVHMVGVLLAPTIVAIVLSGAAKYIPYCRFLILYPRPERWTTHFMPNSTQFYILINCVLTCWFGLSTHFDDTDLP